jgi:hypothetical protein
MTSSSSSGATTFGCALAFWLLVPFPFWLLGMGFAGQFVFLPDRWDLLGVLWVIAFYAPLLLMAWVTIDAFWSGENRSRR